MAGEGKEFECAVCHGTFTKNRSDDEADAEASAIFGEDPGPMVVVCDDCWRRNMPPDVVTEWTDGPNGDQDEEFARAHLTMLREEYDKTVAAFGFGPGSVNEVGADGMNSAERRFFRDACDRWADDNVRIAWAARPEPGSPLVRVPLRHEPSSVAEVFAERPGLSPNRGPNRAQRRAAERGR